MLFPKVGWQCGIIFVDLVFERTCLCFTSVAMTNTLTKKSNTESKRFVWLTILSYCHHFDKVKAAIQVSNHITHAPVRSSERVNSTLLIFFQLAFSTNMFRTPCLRNGTTHSGLCLSTLINNQNNLPPIDNV